MKTEKNSKQKRWMIKQIKNQSNKVAVSPLFPFFLFEKHNYTSNGNKCASTRSKFVLPVKGFFFEKHICAPCGSKYVSPREAYFVLPVEGFIVKKHRYAPLWKQICFSTRSNMCFSWKHIFFSPFEMHNCASCGSTFFSDKYNCACGGSNLFSLSWASRGSIYFFFLSKKYISVFAEANMCIHEKQICASINFFHAKRIHASFFSSIPRENWTKIEKPKDMENPI